jgi:hypothetical protein
LRRRTRYRVVQRHHLSYSPEMIAHIFRSEHGIITKLSRLEKSRPSCTFLQLLEDFIQKQKKSKIPYTESEMKQLYEENRNLRNKRQKEKRA